MRTPGLEGWLTRQWLKRGLAACLMWPAHLLMSALVGLRRQAYWQGWLATDTLSLPVVVVGNRIAGGAGKTPTVLALLAHLQAQGWQPGVLSRGHGRVRPGDDAPLVLDQQTQARLSAREVGDEPWLIWQKTRCPLAVHRRRARAAQALMAAHPEIDILVCDDGLQHLALARQIEIVVFDARGAGNGWLLPAGPLREPLNSPRHPATLGEPIVLYNALAPSTPLPGHLARPSLAPLQSLADWWTGRASTQPDLRGQDCWAVAAIAQPRRFFETLKAQGLDPHPCPLPDHDDLRELPWPLGVRHVIMTEKDAVKLTPQRLAAERSGTQVWVAPLSFEIDDSFWQALDPLLLRLQTSRPPLTHITAQ